MGEGRAGGRGLGAACDYSALGFTAGHRESWRGTRREVTARRVTAPWAASLGSDGGVRVRARLIRRLLLTLGAPAALWGTDSRMTGTDRSG